MLTYRENGSVVELTASGATAYTARQSIEAFQLLDLARRKGGSPSLVLSWLNMQPRSMQPLLASALAERGFKAGCPLCLAGADDRRYSVARAFRVFGVRASRRTTLPGTLVDT